MLAPKLLTNRRLFLIAGDFLVASLAAHLSYASLYRWGYPADYSAALVAPILGLLFVIAIYFGDLYALDRPDDIRELSSKVLRGAVEVLAVCGFVVLLSRPLLSNHLIYVFHVATATFLLICWRLILNRYARVGLVYGVIVLGSGQLPELIAHEIRQRAHLGYKMLNSMIVGRRNRAVGESFTSQTDRAYFASALDSLLAEGLVRLIVIETDEDLPVAPEELVKWRFLGVDISDCESFYERLTGRLPVANLREGWLMSAPGFTRRRWCVAVKRLIDILGASSLMMFTLPIAIVAAIAVKLDSPGPIFYTQDRVGLKKRVFRIRKFRSMRVDAEVATGAVWAVVKDPRVTRVGRIIRRLRIDELPQLINIIKGEMSLVGPRPERPGIVDNLVRTVPLYDYRHCIRPGLTGWAQVCRPYGSTSEDARDKLCYDLFYVKNWSLLLDLQIMLQTVKVVLYGRGAL
jgi:sugar transferase (PEP-CTERM system associated)